MMVLWRLFCALHVGALLAQGIERFNVSTCTVGKLCERRPADCTGDDCDLLISWQPRGDDRLEFELWVPKLEPDDMLNYVALGFSQDSSMGDDGVTYCYNMEDNQRGIGTGHTVGKRFIPHKNDENLLAVELDEIYADEKQLFCKFTQKVDQQSESFQRPNLYQSQHLLLVRGPTLDSMDLNIHSVIGRGEPFASGKVSLAVRPKATDGVNTTQSVSTNGDTTETSFFTLQQSTRSWLKRFHGALMLIAWFGFVSCAVHSARYLKNHWPGTTVSGLQIWFHIHRLLNVLGVVLFVVASVLIFAGTGWTWTGPTAAQPADSNLSSGALHSLLGTIAVLLGVMQPFMALLRCDKHSSKRPIFNIVHQSVGLLALLLSVITTGIAIFGFSELLWRNKTATEVVFCVFLVAIVLILIGQEVIRVLDTRKQHKVTAIELHTQNSASSDNYYYKNRVAHSTRHRHITSLLFVLFEIISIVAVALLTYYSLGGV